MGEGDSKAVANKRPMTDCKGWLWKEPSVLPCWVAWLTIWKTALPRSYQAQLQPFCSRKGFSEMGWWFPTVDPFVLVLATGKTQRVGKMSHYLPWLSHIHFVHPRYPVRSLSLFVYNTKGDFGEVLNHLFNFCGSNIIPPHSCWSEEATCRWLVKKCIVLKSMFILVNTS